MENKTSITENVQHDAKLPVSGTLLLAELMKRKDEKNLNGQPVIRLIDDEIGGGTTYIRYDAMVKTLNDLVKASKQ